MNATLAAEVVEAVNDVIEHAIDLHNNGDNAIEFLNEVVKELIVGIRDLKVELEIE